MIKITKKRPNEGKRDKKRKSTLLEKIVARDIVFSLADIMSKPFKMDGNSVYEYTLAGMVAGLFISTGIGAIILNISSEEAGEGLALLHILYAIILVLSNELIEKTIGIPTNDVVITVASMTMSFVIYEIIISPLILLAANDLIISYLASIPILCLLCIIVTSIISTALGIILKISKRKR